MEYSFVPTESANGYGPYCAYLLVSGDNKIGRAEVQFSHPGDPDQKALLQHHEIYEGFRGNRDGTSRTLDSLIFEELRKRRVHYLNTFVPFCFKLDGPKENPILEYIWQPPPKAYDLPNEGGFRSAKILLTPHLIDGTPVKSEVTGIYVNKVDDQRYVGLTIGIDLNIQSESDWKVAEKVKEMLAYQIR